MLCVSMCLYVCILKICLVGILSNLLVIVCVLENWLYIDSLNLSINLYPYHAMVIHCMHSELVLSDRMHGPKNKWSLYKGGLLKSVTTAVGTVLKRQCGLFTAWS